MVTGQTAMGYGIAAVCTLGLWHNRWLLENTKKGQRLVRWFGVQNGLRVLRGLLIAGVVFGLLLATDVIRPIHWGKP